MKNSRIFGISGVSLLFAGTLFLFSGPLQADVPICGDAKVEGWEECDNGQNNSDEGRDACRSNCVKAKCGDGAQDSAEECDWGYSSYGHINSDQVPNACRRDCRNAHCGDGVLDEGEECDDANSDAYDGCHQCMKCYPPKDDLVLSGAGARLRLCPGNYEFADSGQEGVLILAGEGMVVDCNGAVIIGKPSDLAAKAQLKAQAPLNLAAPKPGGARSKADRLQQAQPPASQPSTPPKPPIAGQTAQILQGTGILVQAKDVVLHNCLVQKFRTGVKLKSSGAILFNNRMCGNSQDIVSESPGNFGVKNKCAISKDWQENGVPACMLGCGN